MAVASYVCGGPVGGSGSSLTIPITVDVPRSDPVDGATIILIYPQFAYLNDTSISSILDDADVEDDYSLCIFADGLNHYGITQFPNFGLLVNPLQSGVHNITIALPGPVDWIQAVAIAITGVGASPLGSGWPSNPQDPAMTWLSNATLATAETPVGTPAHSSLGPAWGQDTFGGITFIGPTGATDGDWDWILGDLSYYFVQQVGFGDDPIHWTWTDGAMTEVAGWSLETVPGRFQAFALASSPIVPSVAGPSIAGVWDNGSFLASGGGIGFAAGTGPICIPVTPPAFGNPTFNRVIPV